MNGFELCEKILALDINVKVCFMSSGEINRKALREIYPSLSVGCLIKKPITIDYLTKRIISELDQAYLRAAKRLEISSSERPRNCILLLHQLAPRQTERKFCSSAIRVIFTPDFATMSLDDTLRYEQT